VSARRAKRRRVLVIEAAAFFRDMVVDLLSRLGHEARGVGSVKEALTLLEKGPAPDLLLVDAHVHGQSPLETLSQLSARRRSPASILLTRRPVEHPELEQLKGLGVRALASKAAPIEDLLIAVEGALFPREQNARRSPRAQVSLPVRYRAADREIHSHSFNLSSDGMFIVTVSAPPERPGTRIDLTFWVPTAAELIHCQGVVIWCNAHGERVNELYPPGMGVMFRDLGSETASKVNAYVLDRVENPLG